MRLHIIYHPISRYDGTERETYLKTLFAKLSRHIPDLTINRGVSAWFYHGRARGVILACGAAEINAPSGCQNDLLECANKLVKECEKSNVSFKGFDSFLFDGMPDEEINDTIKHLRKLAKLQGMRKFKLGHVEDALFVNAR